MLHSDKRINPTYTPSQHISVTDTNILVVALLHQFAVCPPLSFVFCLCDERSVLLKRSSRNAKYARKRNSPAESRPNGAALDPKTHPGERLHMHPCGTS